MRGKVSYVDRAIDAAGGNPERALLLVLGLISTGRINATSKGLSRA